LAGFSRFRNGSDRSSLYRRDGRRNQGTFTTPIRGRYRGEQGEPGFGFEAPPGAINHDFAVGRKILAFTSQFREYIIGDTVVMRIAPESWVRLMLEVGSKQAESLHVSQP
jgi:hypothetical protein